MAKLEQISPELSVVLRECKKEQISRIARILCPEATNGKFTAIQDALMKKYPEMFGGSVFSCLFYQNIYLDNQVVSRTPKIIELLRAAIDAQKDADLKEMWEDIFKSIRWEYLRKPTPEVLARWSETLLGASELGTSEPPLSSSTLPAIPTESPRTPAQESQPPAAPTVPSLTGATFSLPREAVILNSGGSTVIIAPGGGQEVSVVRKADGSTQIVLRSDPSQG